MQYTAVSNPPQRTSRSVVGALAVIAGVVLTAIGIPAGIAAGSEPPSGTQTVPLHNVDASTGQDCPSTDGAFWHFIIAPNNDTHSFVSITLNLAGASTTFAGAQIIPNGSQTDNVFVAVPNGNSFADLQLAGSSALISPATGDVKFVLSHLCQGVPTTTTTTAPSTTTLPCEWDPRLEPDDPYCNPPRTTTTVPETTTTIPETTTTIPETTTTVPETTTTVPETTTTIPETTTTVPETTTTVPETTTTIPEITTTSVESGGPTTTSTTTTTTTVDQLGPTTTVVTSGAVGTTTIATELPRTGSDAGARLTVAGALLVLFGMVLLLTARRPART